MKAEVIALGTELTTGQKLDTNSQWLSMQLGQIGIPVHYHTTVADGLEAMIDLFQTASRRSELVLITGGLGPTLDDLTREAMAGVTGVDLVVDDMSLAKIRDMFERRGRTMPERNQVQAMFPAGSEAIENPRGTAPGIWMPVQLSDADRASTLVAMPGVPSEMKHMFQHLVLPRLPGGQRVIRMARINCFGEGESRIEELLGDLTARGRDPEVGITAHEATITLRITAQGKSEEECHSKIEETARTVRDTLGELVFGEEDEELEDIVISLMKDHGATVAALEIGGSAVLSQRLSRVDPFGGTYRGGITAPALDRLPADLTAGISNDVAADRAVLETIGGRVRAMFDADFVVGTWIPREEVLMPEQHAVVVLQSNEESLGQSIAAVGDFSIHHSRTAKVAKNLLRRHLMGKKPQ